MRRFFLLSICLSLCLACSVRFMGPEFAEFHEATELVGKNVVYLYQELVAEEMRLRTLLAERLDRIRMTDLEPAILTHEQLDWRATAVEYLTGYTELLLEVMAQKHGKKIDDAVRQTFTNLQSINNSHHQFLTPEETGWLTALSGAVMEAATYPKKKAGVLRIMEKNQPLLERIVGILTDELTDTRGLLENILTRQFEEEVVKWWPEREDRRDTVAKRGYKIVQRKNELDIIARDLIAALKVIPSTHRELMESLKRHGEYYRALRDLVHFAYRIDWRYLKYAEKAGEG